MHKLSLVELARALRQREFSSVELTEYFLKRVNQYNDTINAFISVDAEGALAMAKAADKLLQDPEAPILAGIPMAHKDIFCVNKQITTCGSRMLENFVSPYSATIVNKLEQEGAVMLGKTNMDEFAMGATNETSYFGPCRNPWNTEYVPGGSSGGSAAAVGARMVPYTTGSDTGGSIRQPASFCSVSGLKPTYGLVSRFGMIAFASSMDQAGPVAHSAEDLAAILSAMAGFDTNDATSAQVAPTNYLQQLQEMPDLNSMRIGLPEIFFDANVDDEIHAAMDAAIGIFTAKGATVVPVKLDLHKFWVPCYCVLAYAEASANLARYDGIRYGYQAKAADNLFELITRSRDEAFGVEVKRRIITGTWVLSSGYFDDYYVRAQKARRMIQQELQQALAAVDILAGPTAPVLPYKLGEKIYDPVKRTLSDSFTVAANLAGLPALSIPAGFGKSGMPIGMQLMGAAFSEQKLLNFAHFYQCNTDWHLQHTRD